MRRQPAFDVVHQVLGVIVLHPVVLVIQPLTVRVSVGVDVHIQTFQAESIIISIVPSALLKFKGTQVPNLRILSLVHRVLPAITPFDA
ncbi:TPA: hypothetical protein DEG21_05945 [Patescibacteria group bacterium]|nr:hypothetical protein [Candidatus Gracilibacteria bacterium]